tara:strand:+ start:276 stop:464 length:189 start_codon:yes stop_codon:yes gene_type:complete
MPFLPYISPELIDFLIEKEKNEQKKQHERPFLQAPSPYLAEIPENKAPKDSEKDDNVIIIDL